MFPIFFVLNIFFFLQKGFCYVSWWHNGYETPDSDSALSLLKGLNTEWVALLVTWYQDSAHIPYIYRDSLKTPTDASVVYAINRIHSLGMRVTLKLHIDCKSGEWRGYIRPDTQGIWFRNYTQVLKHYAQLAARCGVEQFNIGTELEGTTISHGQEWRAMIDTVRRYFSGRILYGANWDRYQTHVNFWDALDFVGISAYFPLTRLYDPTLQQLLNAWRRRLSHLECFQRRIGKPVIFSEIGYRSVEGANIRPWEWRRPGPVDTGEQRDCYEAALFTFFHLPWVEGFYFWNWQADPNQGGPNDNDYTVNNKPAARIVRDWYSRGAVRERAIVCFPNPGRGARQILMEYSAPKELKIYDLKGSLVLRQVLNQRSGQLDLKDLPPGIYICLIGNSAFKLIQVR